MFDLSMARCSVVRRLHAIVGPLAAVPQCLRALSKKAHVAGFIKLGVLFLGVVITNGLLLGIYDGAPEPWKLPSTLLNCELGRRMLHFQLASCIRPKLRVGHGFLKLLDLRKNL